MTGVPSERGVAQVNGAQIHYEIAGEGEPFLMIHAGVADSRQWDNEFAHFAQRYRVLRYDMRGYGQSEPVEGEFSHLGDLTALLAHLGIDRNLIAMGCSMGGGLAMNLALAQPELVKALVMVGSAPSGLDLDAPEPSQSAAAEQAWEARDIDLTCELETQIWFDGAGRTPDQVNPAMRKLVFDMNRIALQNEARGIGKRVPDAETPAYQRLHELQVPVLVIVGAHDIAYMQAAAGYMLEHIPSARKATIEDAAHLPNLDHPEEFRQVLTTFLEEIEHKV